MMRQAWAPVGQHISSGFNSTLDFFIAYPPFAQGGYYVLTALWPLISMSSFERVTGPRVDTWLVYTVALLSLVIGATLCIAAYRREGTPEIFCLALGSALTFIFIHLFYVFHGRISAVYLVDVVAESALVVLWLYGWRTGRTRLHGCRPDNVAVPAAPTAAPAPPYAAAPYAPAAPVAPVVPPPQAPTGYAPPMVPPAQPPAPRA
jgi:hypothetical protein